MCVCVCVHVVAMQSFSHVQLFCDPIDWSLPGFSAHGISQARIWEWVAIFFSRRSSQPREWTQVSCTGRRILYHWATREAHVCVCVCVCVYIYTYILIHTYIHIWRRQWHPTPVLLPGISHGWRSLVGCSPWGCKESDTTEWLHFDFSLSCIGEGNSNPLQCSCLENPRDGGAWWAAVYGVTQSRTQLKRLSSSSSR